MFLYDGGEGLPKNYSPVDFNFPDLQKYPKKRGFNKIWILCEVFFLILGKTLHNHSESELKNQNEKALILTSWEKTCAVQD